MTTWTINKKSDYLEHHGIKGQKWGVRRYQNLDGSLTPAGKQHLSENKANDIDTIVDMTKKAKKTAALKTLGGVATIGLSAAMVPMGFFHPFLPLAGAINIASGVRRSAEANKSLKKLNEIKERRSTEKTDKNGLCLKNSSTSLADDIINVNPYKTETNNSSLNNCTNCSVALDFRLRGYDVMAYPKSVGRTRDEFGELYKNIVRESYSEVPDFRANDRKVSNSDPVSSSEAANIVSSMNTKLSKEKNSNGVVWVSWIGANGSGHAMSYVVQNGDVTYIDAQANKTYTEKQFKDLMKRTTGYVETARLDNLKINMKNAKGWVL